MQHLAIAGQLDNQVSKWVFLLYFFCYTSSQNTWMWLLQIMSHDTSLNRAIHLSSSWWRTPSRALQYWRLVVKYSYLLPSSMLYGSQSSEAEHPHQMFSARWFLVVQQVSSNLLVVLEQQRWHGGDLPQGLSEPGVQRTSGGRTSPYWRLASIRWFSRLSHW